MTVSWLILHNTLYHQVQFIVSTSAELLFQLDSSMKRLLANITAILIGGL